MRARVKKQYYFFVSSLPTLVFGRKPPVDFSLVAQYCKTYLDTTDLIILNKIISGDADADRLSRFYYDWRMWDQGLSKELAALRAHKINCKENGRPFALPGRHPEYQGLLTRLFSVAHPLEAEMMLAKARWKHLDEMEFGCYFNFEKIISYVLKLQIMERLESFDQIEGGHRLDTALNAILKTAKPFAST
jgi:hypothetical protein